MNSTILQVLLVLWDSVTSALLIATAPARSTRAKRVGLYPLSHADLSECAPHDVLEKWRFSLLERDDLGKAAQFALDCFYTPRVMLKTEGATGVELWLLNGIKDVYSKVDRSDTYNGNYLGFWSRSNTRLDKPSVAPTSDSLILVATRRNDPLTTETKICGMVEVCLEMADGKLAPPIQLPWKGGLNGEEQPYLCNLCVDTSLRRQGLGKILVNVVENLIVKHWGKSAIYLHVESSNVVAQHLYGKMDYNTVGREINELDSSSSGQCDPFFSERGYGAKVTTYPEIFYYKKNLTDQRTKSTRNSTK